MPQAVRGRRSDRGVEHPTKCRLPITRVRVRWFAVRGRMAAMARYRPEPCRRTRYRSGIYRQRIPAPLLRYRALPSDVAGCCPNRRALCGAANPSTAQTGRARPTVRRSTGGESLRQMTGRWISLEVLFIRSQCCVIHAVVQAHGIVFHDFHLAGNDDGLQRVLDRCFGLHFDHAFRSGR